jgi:hypothetical protein
MVELTLGKPFHDYLRVFYLDLHLWVVSLGQGSSGTFDRNPVPEYVYLHSLGNGYGLAAHPG